MSGPEVKLLFRQLAKSQGLYGRIIQAIEEQPNPEEVYAEIGKDCKDAVDVVLKIEA